MPRRALTLSVLLVREWEEIGLMLLGGWPPCETGLWPLGDGGGAPELPAATLLFSKLFRLRLRYRLAESAVPDLVIVRSSLVVRCICPIIGGGGGVYRCSTAPMPEPEGAADEAVESLEIELLESTRCAVLRYRFGDDFGVTSKGVSERSGTLDDRFIKEFLAEPVSMSSLLGLR